MKKQRHTATIAGHCRLIRNTAILGVIILASAVSHAALPEPLIHFDFGSDSLTQPNQGSINTSLAINAPAILAQGGVSGAGDYAFSNAIASGMGSSAIGTNRDGVATASFTLPSSSTFTITGWFNAETQINSAARILQKTNTNAGISLYGNNGALAVEINGKSAVLSDAVFNETGKWIFFAVTYSWNNDTSTGVVNFYIGSTTSGSITSAGSFAAASGTGVLAASTSDLRIGNDPGKTRPFDGFLDDIRIYKETLDATQLNEVRLQSIPEPSHIALSFGLVLLSFAFCLRMRLRR